MRGVDLNWMEHFSEFFRGDAHEHRQDPVRPAHGLSAMDYLHADRRPVRQRSPGPDAFLCRAIPGHGLRPTDLPREPARHRDLPLGLRVETLSHGLSPTGPVLDAELTKPTTHKNELEIAQNGVKKLLKAPDNGGGCKIRQAHEI